MTTPRMTIDGHTVHSTDTFEVLDPATGEAFSVAPECSREQLEQAMTSCANAFESWRSDDGLRRKKLLDCADALEKDVDAMAETITREQGKPLARSIEEIMGSVAWFRYTASLEIPCDKLHDSDDACIEVERRPLGVVAAITPWNYPVLLLCWKIAPALLAGNTVVAKPSPHTPLATLRLGERLREVLPPGVLNVISGGDELGAWMTQHPTPNKITFTGSVETGKRVALAAASDLKRLTLELGGNDPAILLPDVDLKRAAKKLFWGAFANNGQTCGAIKRIYVHEQQIDALTSELAQIAESVRVGNGMEAGTELGPINNRGQFERVISLVDDARNQGASIVTGGQPRPGPGYFYEPTIVMDATEGMRLVDEEQFGPALPVLHYRDVEDAIERANRGHFGLSGSIWSADIERATQLARRLECGTTYVNQHFSILPMTPFGGTRWSGLGVENGAFGLEGFFNLQTVNVDRSLDAA